VSKTFIAKDISYSKFLQDSPSVHLCHWSPKADILKASINSTRNETVGHNRAGYTGDNDSTAADWFSVSVSQTVLPQAP